MNASMETFLPLSQNPNGNSYNRLEPVPEELSVSSSSKGNKTSIQSITEQQMKIISEMHEGLEKFVREHSDDSSKELLKEKLQLIGKRIELLEEIVKLHGQKSEEPSAVPALEKQNFIQTQKNTLMNDLSELFSSLCNRAVRKMSAH